MTVSLLGSWTGNTDYPTNGHTHAASAGSNRVGIVTISHEMQAGGGIGNDGGCVVIWGGQTCAEAEMDWCGGQDVYHDMAFIGYLTETQVAAMDDGIVDSVTITNGNGGTGPFGNAKIKTAFFENVDQANIISASSKANTGNGTGSTATADNLTMGTLDTDVDEQVIMHFTSGQGDTGGADSFVAETGWTEEVDHVGDETNDHASSAVTRDSQANDDTLAVNFNCSSANRLSIVVISLGAAAAELALSTTINTVSSLTTDLSEQTTLGGTITSVSSLSADISEQDVLGSTIASVSLLITDLSEQDVLGSTIATTSSLTADLSEQNTLGSTIASVSSLSVALHSMPNVYLNTSQTTAGATKMPVTSFAIDGTSIIFDDPSGAPIGALFLGVENTTTFETAWMAVTVNIDTVALAAIITTASSLTTDLSEQDALAATLSTVSSFSADLSEQDTLDSTIATISTLNVDILEQDTLGSTIATTSSFSVDILEQNTLGSTVASISTFTADISELDTLVSTIPTVTVLTADISEQDTLAATLTTISSFNADLSAGTTLALNATITTASSFTIALLEQDALDTTIATISSLTADILEQDTLDSTITVVSSLTSAILELDALFSTVATVSLLTVNASQQDTLNSTIATISSLISNLSELDALDSTITTISSLIADLAVVLVTLTDVNTTESWNDGDTGLVATGTGFV